MPLSLMNLFILPFTYHKASSDSSSQADSPTELHLCCLRTLVKYARGLTVSHGGSGQEL